MLDGNGFPTLRDYYEHLSRIVDDNERVRFRHLGWLGTTVAALAVLVWGAISLLEQVSGVWNVPALLTLVVLVYLLFRYFDAVLPAGVYGLLEAATGATKRGLDPRLLLMILRENLHVLREKIVFQTVLDILLTAPLVATYAVTPPGLLAAGEMTLGTGLFRWVMALVVMAVFLRFLQPRFIDAALQSLTETEQLVERWPRLLLFAYKIGLVGRAASLAAATVYYGVQVSFVALAFSLYAEPTWGVLRLVLVVLALVLLGRFAAHLWEKVRDVQEWNEIWLEVRRGILFGEFTTVNEVQLALREAAEDVVQARAFPLSIPEGAIPFLLPFPPRTEAHG